MSIGIIIILATCALAPLFGLALPFALALDLALAFERGVSFFSSVAAAEVAPRRGVLGRELRGVAGFDIVT